MKTQTVTFKRATYGSYKKECYLISDGTERVAKEFVMPSELEAVIKEYLMNGYNVVVEDK